MVGACLILFSLAFTERSLAAYVCIAEKKINNDLIKLSLAHKRPATSQYLAPKARLHGDEEEGDCESIMGIMGSTDSVQYHDNVVKPHPVPPFAFRIEIKRGMNRAASAVFHYVLMLAVMSFNVGFILSVIAGLAVGEMTFARFAI